MRWARRPVTTTEARSSELCDMISASLCDSKSRFCVSGTSPFGTCCVPELLHLGVEYPRLTGFECFRLRGGWSCMIAPSDSTCKKRFTRDHKYQQRNQSVYLCSKRESSSSGTSMKGCQVMPRTGVIAKRCRHNSFSDSVVLVLLGKLS